MKKLFKISFIKDFLSYGFIGILGKAINVFAIPFYASVLNVEDFGLLDLFSSSLMILSLVATFQLETSFLRFFSELKNENEIKQYFSSGLNIILLLLIPFCLISYFALYYFYKEVDYKLLLGTIISIPITSIFAYITCIYRVTFKRQTFVKINLINILGVPIFSILAVYLGCGVLGIIAVTIIINSISLLFVILNTKEYYIKGIDKNITSKMFSYSIPLIPSSFSVILQQNLTNFVISGFLGLTILGYYAFALKIFIPITLVFQSLKMAWYPRAFQLFDKDKNFDQKFKRVEKYYFILIFLSYLFLLYFSSTIINYIGGDKMKYSIELVGLIGLIILTRAASYFYIVVQNIIKNTKSIFISNFVSLIFLIISLLILKSINQLNIKLIIISEVVCEIIKLILIIYSSKKSRFNHFNYYIPLSIILIISTISIYLYI